MKKLLIFGVLGLVALGALGGGGYYAYLQLQPKEDHSVIVVDTTVGKPKPPPFSVSGKVFEVPNMGGVTTTIAGLYPTARRDYPMGQFTSVDGKITGKLAIIDDFVTPYFNNHRAVPMLVTTGSADERYYLTILEGDDMRYATSVPIGDHIKITDVSRKDDEVTVQYLVHDKNQAMEDIPIVGTSAIINIATGVLLQAGRNPATEEVIADKFTGKYYWISTKNADGSVVQPDVADYFAISFGGTNITLSTDCNTGGSTISVGAGSSTTFTVGAIDITKKPCSSRFEGQYFAMFGKVVSYSEPSAGKLILKFADGGSMVFLTEAEKNAPSPAVATSTATGTASSTKK